MALDTTIKLYMDGTIYSNVVRYLTSFDSIKEYIATSYKQNSITGDYTTTLCLSHGIHTVMYKDKPIEIKYTINNEKPVGLSFRVDCLEECILRGESKEFLCDFFKYIFFEKYLIFFWL